MRARTAAVAPGTPDAQNGSEQKTGSPSTYVANTLVVRKAVITMVQGSRSMNRKSAHLPGVIEPSCRSPSTPVRRGPPPGVAARSDS